MLRKIYAYQRLLCNDYAYSSKGKTIAILLFAPMFLLFIVDAVMGFRVGAPLTGLIVLVFFLPNIIAANHTSRFMRMLPVSDHFVVANRLFLFPLIFPTIVVFALLLFELLFGVLFYFIKGEIWINNISMIKIFYNIPGIVFSIFILYGIWFLFCISAFHRDKKKKIIGCYAVWFLCFLGSMAAVHGARMQGIYSVFSLTDIPEVYENIPMIPISILFACAAGLLAWKQCLRLYRADLAGQRKSVLEDEKNMEAIAAMAVQLYTEKGKRNRRIIIALCVIALLLVPFGIGFLFANWISSGTEEMTLDYQSNVPSDYADWESYSGHAIMEEEDFVNSALLIFPDDVQTDTVDEYYAFAEGSYGIGESSSWMDCSWARFLAVTLPEEEYIKEKARISNLSLTCGGEEDGVKGLTNPVLHDTEHFSTDCYIAVFSDPMGYYEYALTSDENHQILYVYGENFIMDDIPTEKDILPKSPRKVISIRTANDGFKGYSIYSFFDSDYHHYVTWLP